MPTGFVRVFLSKLRITDFIRPDGRVQGLVRAQRRGQRAHLDSLRENQSSPQLDLRVLPTEQALGGSI